MSGITCQWTQLSGPEVRIDDERACDTGFPAPSLPGTLIFVLEVRDQAGTGASSVAEVTFSTDASGNLQMPEPERNPSGLLPAGPEDGGCGCTAVEGEKDPSGVAFGVLILGALGLRRRRLLPAR
jgi:MYXO-CTERM domain-containing protein